MNNIDSKLRYAGFWIRILAISVDYTILALPFLLFNASFIVLILLFEKSLPIPISAYISLMLIVLCIIVTIYFVGFNSSKVQGTIGKRACNIFIGNSINASRIKKTKAFGRFVFLGVLLIVNKIWSYSYENQIIKITWMYWFIVYVLLVIPFLLAVITTQKTTLHDILFKTRVYHGRPNFYQAKENIYPISNYLVFGILIILWGVAIPLFNEDIFFSVWCVILLYVLFVLITLFYYKNTSPVIYAQYSFIKNIENLKPFFWALIPIVFLLMSNYGIILYVKITMG